MTHRILVVDDEPDITALVAYHLAKTGYRVSTATNGADALRSAREERPDIVVLDLMLPGLSGYEVLAELRKRDETRDVGVILLTARREEADRIKGLSLGADDYLTKPFSPRELVARVRAVFRRTELGPARGDVIRAGGITLDIPRMQARVGKRAIELTSTEFELLATMMRQPGRVFTRGQLLDAVRGEDIESFDRAIDAHIKNLRRKLEADPRQPRFVLTVYGVGYKFADA